MARWKLRKVDQGLASRLARETGLPLPLARILAGRGITGAGEANTFLSPGIGDLHDPLMMDGMATAVRRILLAREQKERVLLFGDYDVDGITATAAMGRLLDTLGIPYSRRHPDRLTEGYGFNRRAVEIARGEGAGLIIALDCGTGAVGPVGEAQSLGIDVVVIDHHIQEGEISPASAVVNPKKRACPYPFDKLVTAGLVLKVARALVEINGRDDALSIPWGELLQLAALATVADVAPLRGENRIITHLGLEALRHCPLPGLAALARAAGIRIEAVSAGNLAMQIAPRINAAGRIGSPEKAADLLFESSPPVCKEIADNLHDLNRERQDLERGILEEAIARVEEKGGAGGKKTLVVEGRGWHQGVVGIVAARLAEKYYRPAVVIAVGEDGRGHGSARSIPSFDLFDALSRCNEDNLFSSFGGHRAAAGLSLPAEKIAPFREKMEAVAEGLLSGDDLVPTLSIDAFVSLGEITFGLLENLERLAPFGKGNPRPVFALEGLRVVGSPGRMGRNRDHLRARFAAPGRGGPPVDCVGWRMADLLPELTGGLVDIACVTETNHWRGLKSVRLVLKDILPSKGGKSSF